MYDPTQKTDEKDPYYEMDIPRIFALYQEKVGSFVRANTEAGICEAEYNSWNKKEKDYLKALMHKIDGPEGVREETARASSEWQEYRKAQDEAFSKLCKAKTRVENVKEMIEFFQRLISAKQTEIKNFKG